MKIPATKLIILSAACALAACSTVTVTTDYNHAAPFGKYKTYTLAPASAGQTLSPASEAALRNSLRTQLASRGITETSSSKANLMIVRQVSREEKVSVQERTTMAVPVHSVGRPYGVGTYGVWAGAPQSYTDVTQYTQGTLVLNLVDTRTNQLVFRGVGTAVISGPESNARKIEEAVAKMVAALPAAR
jgi:hypothetical protein